MKNDNFRSPRKCWMMNNTFTVYCVLLAIKRTNLC